MLMELEFSLFKSSTNLKSCGHLIIKDSLLCSWGKKAVIFLPELNPLNVGTLLIGTLSLAPSVSLLTLSTLRSKFEFSFVAPIHLL